MDIPLIPAAVTGGLTAVGTYYFVQNSWTSAMTIGLIAAGSVVLSGWIGKQFSFL
jgi:ABC-type enterobactin transport system permease subunit